METQQKKGPPIQVIIEKCVGCLSCELRCSLRRVKAFSPIEADIKVRRVAGGENDFHVALTDDCDYCGICVLHCMYGALTQPTRVKEVAADL